MKRRMFVLGMVVLALAGCVIRDSPAPGCRQTIGIGMGGCEGKTAILDLVVEPQPECLQITANNCNGGVLTISNGCDEALALGGVTVGPAERGTFDIVEAEGGWALVDTPGNFAVTIPTADVFVELSGDLGGQPISVSFTKTAPLCE